jgi:hypothetical protein
MTFGWAYFVIARDDIAEYGTVAGKYINSTKRKLYAKAKFSVEAFEALQEQISAHKRTLKAYGVVPRGERKEYPIPHGVLRENLNAHVGHAPNVNVAQGKV